MNSIFSLNSNDWTAFRPIFVGLIPAGEYRAEILHIEICEDAPSPYAIAYYHFEGGGSYDLAVRYYADSRWWRDFSRALASYGVSSVEDAVGLKETVTISEPTNGGRYMEITARRRADDGAKKSLSPGRPRLGTVSSRLNSKKVAKVEDDDEFENELGGILEDDFLEDGEE